MVNKNFYTERRGGLSRLDVLPFLIFMYLPLLFLTFKTGLIQAYTMDGTWEPVEEVVSLDEESIIEDTAVDDFEMATVVFVLWIIGLLGHLVFVLMSYWYPWWRIMIRYRPVDDIEQASHVYMSTSERGEKDEVCALSRIDSPNLKCVMVDFNKQTMVYNTKTKDFEIVSADTKIDLSELYRRSCTGLSRAEVTKLDILYGVNNFDIVLPTFLELFKDHAVAPFFVFQIVTMILWMLDEMWQYALFSMVMLIIMECQLVARRLKEMEDMTNMKLTPRNIYVYRDCKWRMVTSDNLVPGDIISLRTNPGSPRSETTVPADILLLNGTILVNESILTGESVPQLKVSLESIYPSEKALNKKDERGKKVLDIEGEHKNMVLYAGTHILQQTSPSTYPKSPPPFGEPPPDEGVLAYVLNTGFRTHQGSLVRSILYSSERVTSDSKEAYMFIGVLLIAAVLAAAYVLKHELKNASRSKFQLTLSCIIIITSVVPAEFPVTMSMSVQLTLMKLLKNKIYCTEPFRVPMAGRLDYCAFDKTGTLTSEKLYLGGIVGLPTKSGGLSENLVNLLDRKQLNHRVCQSLPFMSMAVMGACHSLILVKPSREDPKQQNPNSIKGGGTQMQRHADAPELDPEPAGDPLELAMFNALKFNLSADGHITAPETANHCEIHWKIVRRFTFNSELQRMLTVVEVVKGFEPFSHEDDTETNTQAPYMCRPKDASKYIILVKGAWEKLITFMQDVDSRLHEMVKQFTRRGLRVIAMGARWITETELIQLDMSDRAKLERHIEFCGLACLQCPLKADSAKVVSLLNASNYRTLMITGDHPFTAAEVAAECNIITRKHKVLMLEQKGDGLHLVDLSTDSVSPYRIDQVKRLRVSNNALLLTGPVMDIVPADDLVDLIHNTTIFSRVSPPQKRVIIRTLGKYGSLTLMCGDGTNDVGALKEASIGISLISAGPETREELNRHLGQFSSNTDPLASVIRLDDGMCVSFNQLPKTTRTKWTQLRGQAMVNKWMKNEATAQMIDKGMAELKHEIETLKKEQPRSIKEAGDQVGQGVAEGLQNRIMDLNDDEVPALKLGDASIASPFAYKGSSIRCVEKLIRYGQATLATVHMTYMIMALNALVTAFSLSVLTLDGVKFGDAQNTIESIFVSVLFLQCSRAPAADSLAATRPRKTIFERTFMISFVLQAAIHMSTLYIAWRMASHGRGDQYDPDVYGTFYPNLTNTTMWLVMATTHGATFGANYPGHPFVTSFWSSTSLKLSLFSFMIFMIILASEALPEANTYLSLVTLPSTEYRNSIIALVLLDFFCAFAVSWSCNWWAKIREEKRIKIMNTA